MGGERRQATSHPRGALGAFVVQGSAGAHGPTAETLLELIEHPRDVPVALGFSAYWFREEPELAVSVVADQARKSYAQESCGHVAIGA